MIKANNYTNNVSLGGLKRKKLQKNIMCDMEQKPNRTGTKNGRTV